MLPEEWPRAKAVLSAAIKLPSGERTRFISAALPQDLGLWDELLAILDGYDQATGVIVNPAQTARVSSVPVVASMARPAPTLSSGPLLNTGSTYGPYRVLKQLGAGGMGQVFLAEDMRLGRQVAIKSLAGQWLQSPTARLRLMREARAVAALTHPHIATLYDVLDDAPHLLLVMEYVEGRPVSALLRDGPIALGHTLRLAIQMTDAVGYAHDRGIIHCDIKPANVQVALDGTAKVLDFGLARVRYEPDDTDDLAIADQGKLLGTPGYIAPERLTRGTLNTSGDIYSLGVVIFEMATGRRPFHEPDVASLLLAVLGSPPPKPSSLVPGVPALLDDVVNRALARDPRHRYQSARELSRDLRMVLASLEGSAPGSVAGSWDQTTVRAAARLAAPWQRTLMAGATAVSGFLLVVTLAGFVTSMPHASIRGRDFVRESPLWWPYWGFRSMVAPLGLMGGMAVGVSLLTAGCRLSLAVCEPLRRWSAPTRTTIETLSHRLRAAPSAALAQALLCANIIGVVLMVWRFSDLLDGIGNVMAQHPEHLALLAPDNAAQHNSYRQLLSLQLCVFGVAWYRLLRFRYERGDRDGVPTLAGAVAVMAVVILLLAAPWRILHQNDGERVSYASQPCYLIGQRVNEALLFCPRQPPPWNRIVRLDDPMLKREHVIENVFADLDRNR